MFYTWDWLYCITRTGNGAVPGAAVAVTPVADEGVQEKLNQVTCQGERAKSALGVESSEETGLETSYLLPPVGSRE